MILKNQLNDARLGCLIVVGGMKEFFTSKKELRDNYKELEEVGFFEDYCLIINNEWNFNVEF